MAPTEPNAAPGAATPSGSPPGGPQPQDTSIFATFNRILVWMEEGMLVLLFLTLLGVGLTQIIMRNVVGSTPADIETILRALVLWVAMLGAAVAARRKRHIVVDLLSHYLKPRPRKLVGFIANLFTAFICLLLTWAGLKMIQLELSFQPVALFGPIPRWLVQLPMPLAFAVMTSQYLIHSLEDLVYFFRPALDPSQHTASVTIDQEESTDNEPSKNGDGAP